MTASPPLSLENDPVEGPSTPIVNLSGYRFVALDDLQALRSRLSQQLTASGVVGTLLLAEEGINVALAGSRSETDTARAILDDDARFHALWLKESLSTIRPFAKLKVRIRREIIAFDGDQALETAAARPAAPHLDPAILRRWLDDNRELTLLDTRNAYEVASGSFTRANSLDMEHFRNFGEAVRAALDAGTLDRARPVVTFCTGGVRCEKAAPWLLENGFQEVWQIDGGVLNWFEQCGDAHWSGECFVFDDRVEIDPSLAPTGASLCTDCHRAVPRGTLCPCQSSRTAIDTV